jgi:hypothetical protein
VFDLHSTDKIRAWKEFREDLEKALNPLNEVALLWSKAPFVNRYLSNQNPKDWPDPWKLIIDGKYDDLAIALGMCYTLQLTERFKANQFEIHTAAVQNELRYILVIDNEFVLNWEHRAVARLSDLPQTIKIWTA